jgi:hypothetical protein
MPIHYHRSGSHDEKRSLHDDERYVMDVYQSHAHVCQRCGDSRFLDSLCEQGTLLARNVRRYLYKESGKSFATVGHEYVRTNRVDIPQDAYSLRNLLAAMERGSQPCHSFTSPQYPIEIVERRPRQWLISG